MLELQLVTTVCSLATLTTGCVATNHQILSGSSSQQSPISRLRLPAFMCSTLFYYKTGYLIFDIYTYLCQIYMTEIPIESFHNF